MRLYHRTSRKSANLVLVSRTWESKDSQQIVWFSTRPDGHAVGYGDVVLEVDAPSGSRLAKSLELNDEFPDGEKHYTTHVRNLLGVRVREWTAEVKPSRSSPAPVVDITGRLAERERVRRCRARGKIEGVLTSAADIMASDPGFQAAARARKARRTMAEHAAGPQRFRPGDRVVYAGTDGAIPADWVGRVTHHEWYSEDELGDVGGERPAHYYTVEWTNPRRDKYSPATQQGFHPQGDLRRWERGASGVRR